MRGEGHLSGSQLRVTKVSRRDPFCPRFVSVFCTTKQRGVLFADDLQRGSVNTALLILSHVAQVTPRAFSQGRSRPPFFFSKINLLSIPPLCITPVQIALNGEPAANRSPSLKLHETKIEERAARP